MSGAHLRTSLWLSAPVLAVALGLGCSRSVAPAALVDMRSLPEDPQKRNQLLDSAAVRPGPENRKPLPAKLHQVETGAATAAAILGMIFSKSPNVLLGAGGPIDENQLFDPSSRQARPGAKSKAADAEQGEDPAIDANQLVPWVRLGPPAPPE